MGIGMSERLHVLILAGGSGRRLWPWSRPGIRKPELPLVSDCSPLDETVESALLFAPPERIHLVAAEGYLSDPGFCQWITEPRGRNTLPAIMRGVEVLYQQDPEAFVLVLPADQHVIDRDRFRRGLLETVRALDVQPDTFWIHGTVADPSPDFGFISLDTCTGSIDFVEKPTPEKIQQIQSEFESIGANRKSFRHCGIFGFGARFFLEQMKLRGVESSEEAPELSIDHFLLGEDDFAGCLEFRDLAHRWSDLGDWKSIREIKPGFHSPTSQVSIRWSLPETVPRYPFAEPLALDGESPVIHGDLSRRVVALGMDRFEIFCDSSGIRILGSDSQGPLDPGRIVLNATGESLEIHGIAGGLVVCMDDLILICSERGLISGLIPEASQILDSEMAKGSQ